VCALKYSLLHHARLSPFPNPLVPTPIVPLLQLRRIIFLGLDFIYEQKHACHI
jgi:hypothetical protein